MKLRVTTEQDNVSGYVNCLPKSNIDDIAVDNECNEILALDLVNYFSLVRIQRS